ncbi:MAG: hypothetical protein QG610_634 [Euryarchaeota archaeon]|nr:hypothetical protein [Euryarchaeota archaeon]
MAKNPADREKEVEKITESFRKSFILWLNQGKVGKISLEINTGEGSISRSYVKTEAQI